MNEQLLAAAWQQVCDNLLVLRKSKVWRSTHSCFNDYVIEVWCLSKTRAKLYCDFSTFSAMCRAEYLKVPTSPDVVKPILELPMKRWIETWIICIDKAGCNPDNKSIRATMDFFGIGVRRRVPKSVLKTRKVRAAAKTLAEMGDGEKLVEEIGPAGLGHDWDMGLRVAIDADQAKMNKRGDK